MKNTIYFIILFITTGILNACAQDLKLKDGQVIQGNKVILSYDKKALNTEFHLYVLNTETPIVDIKQIHRGNGETSAANDYKSLRFSKQNKLIESTILRTRNWKFIIQLLLDEKVIDTNGVVNVANLERFAINYDEKITPR